MKLLDDKHLLWSTVVANNRMNRTRRASGVNSYAQEIGFSPEAFLQEFISLHGSVTWLDICCGEGNALIDTANSLAQYGLQHKAALTGIDLVDHFSQVPPGINCVQLKVGDIMEGITGTYDLITCIHGIHYLGDKLRLLENICAAVTENGMFIGNFAAESIKGEDVDMKKRVTAVLRKAGLNYNARKRLLSCNGNKRLSFGWKYLGADDTAGPNYTGQEAVDSWYQC